MMTLYTQTKIKTVLALFYAKIEMDIRSVNLEQIQGFCLLSKHQFTEKLHSLAKTAAVLAAAVLVYKKEGISNSFCHFIIDFL